MIMVTNWAYIHAQSEVIGQGNNIGIVVTTSDNAQGTDGTNTLTSQGYLPNLNAASRFLSQATFGPNFEDIDNLSNQGIEEWIETQFGIARPYSIKSKMQEYQAILAAGTGEPDANAHGYYWNMAWWQYAMSSSDALRQRIALALSEFFVISDKSELGSRPYALTSYYDMLLDNAFGNYRDLLEEVTYHPAMGLYLTYMNNVKADTLYEIDWSQSPPDTLSTQFIFPDENYAREVMQLFSIGLYMLEPDGAHQKNAQGQDMATYDNVDIAEFAKIFTGFSYGDTQSWGWPDDYEEGVATPMQIFNNRHEPGPKELLLGSTIPSRNPVNGDADVSDALDNLFNHPNVGPFFGKFLIQRLVTSNPSPGYVARVTAAFDGDSPYGTERGDMQAIIKAILLDEEARSCFAAEDDTYGHLREPFVRYMQLGQAFDYSSPSGNLRNVMNEINDEIAQRPLSSPSVFNFFQSDYTPIGVIEEAGKVAPEFQMTNTQSIAGYFNGLNEWIIDDDYVDAWDIYQGEPDFSDEVGAFDLSDEIQLVEEGRHDQLVERLNLILAHGKLSQRTLDIITGLISTTDMGSDLGTVNLAIYMVMSCPEYLINR